MIKVIKTYKILFKSSYYIQYKAEAPFKILNSQIFYFEIKHFLNSFQKNVHFSKFFPNVEQFFVVTQYHQVVLQRFIRKCISSSKTHVAAVMKIRPDRPGAFVWRFLESVDDAPPGAAAPSLAGLSVDVAVREAGTEQ